MHCTLVASDEIGAKAAKANPDPSIEEMLNYAIQDEYLARAEYYEVMDRFGNVRPFSQIVKSEETHVKMLVPLFERLKSASENHLRAFEKGLSRYE